jgi:hypothetical protein
MKLGLKPAVPGAVKLRLGTYLNWRELPQPPTHFGHADLVKNWGMMANGAAEDNPPGLPDGAGCCAFAGPVHQTMLWCAEGQRPAPFSAESTLENYSAVTGFRIIDPITGAPYPPDQNPTDQGTALDDMAKYWRTNGLIDDDGNAHKILAYVDMNPGDLRELWLVSWLFQSACMGYELPESALEQSQAGVVWDVVPGSPIAGGHCVPTMARLSETWGLGVSWGKKQPFTDRWFTTYNTQGIAALDEEMLINARSIDGIDDAMLRDDLEQVTTA